MAKVYSLDIKNFRGIKKFSHTFGFNDFICIIGKGDSGKTTILEAISYVLSPSWNINFYDTDFFDCDTELPIEITATLYSIPDKLLSEDRYGLFQRFIDKVNGSIQDEIINDCEPALTIQLSVEKNLEPKWFVINSRQSPIEIKSSHRALFNAFLISDYLDKHFSWNRGSLLSSLLQNIDEKQLDENIVLTALRDAKNNIDKNGFSNLNLVLEKLKPRLSSYGVDASNAISTVDFKDLFTRDNKITLHDSRIPFRLKGKGSKRLTSIALQTELAKLGGIILIDELEQGLEPDRAQHLARSLKSTNQEQVFITTHSRDILVELQTIDLQLMKRNADSLFKFSENMQGCIRKNPEAFFAKRILLCEGATEIGLCRSINNNNIASGKDNAAILGVRFVDGTGSTSISYARSFKHAGYDVCLFCDSDNEEINKQKLDLEKMGIKIIDCELGNAIENQIFKDLPWEGIRDLLTKLMEISGKEQIVKSVEAKLTSSFSSEWWLSSNDIEEKRQIIGEVAKNSGWFKQIGIAEEILGKVCCTYYMNNLLGSSRLFEQLKNLNAWLYSA